MVVEAPVEQAAIVGGRGRQLAVSRDGSSQCNIEVKVTTDLGKPVRGRDGVVGWMHDHEAVTKKVSGNVYVNSCYTLYFVAGINFATTSIFVTITSIIVLDRDSD